MLQLYSNKLYSNKHINVRFRRCCYYLWPTHIGDLQVQGYASAILHRILYPLWEQPLRMRSSFGILTFANGSPARASKSMRLPNLNQTLWGVPVRPNHPWMTNPLPLNLNHTSTSPRQVASVINLARPDSRMVTFLNVDPSLSPVQGVYR